MDLVLLSAPPFSPAMWDGVAARLRTSGLTASSVDLLDDVDDGRVDAVVDNLVRTGALRGTCVVAHGLAVPVALACARTEAGVARLFLANGPLQQGDPLRRALGLVPRTALRVGLRPEILLPALASSLALRRTVANPYVMDRDTVVAVCGPPVEGRSRRRRVAEFLSSVADCRVDGNRIGAPVTLIWGDEDVLYPLSVADQARALFNNVDLHVIPGGRWLHPIERPWAFADAIAERVAGSTAT